MVSSFNCLMSPHAAPPHCGTVYVKNESICVYVYMYIYECVYVKNERVVGVELYMSMHSVACMHIDMYTCTHAYMHT